MWIAIGIGGGVLVVLVIFLIAGYNSASKKKLRVDNAFSQIKIQYKRRADLVPYLADVVKGYAKFETATSGVFAQANDAVTPQGLADAEQQTNRALKSLFAAAQDNPAVRSNANFLQLQTELTNLEKAISVSRGFYNDAVMMYNRTVQMFPTNIAAKIFRFKPAEFLDQSAADASGYMKGAKCPSCGAVSDSPICPHCGTRIPLI